MDLDLIAKKLCSQTAERTPSLSENEQRPMPSVAQIEEMMQLLRKVLFPGFFSTKSSQESSALRYHVAADLDSIRTLLTEQIACGICFSCVQEKRETPHCNQEAAHLASLFIQQLPSIQDLLASDVIAAYEGDPAAKSMAETIFCYPSILAMTHHRVAHALYRLDIPILPRIISEWAHSKTGIDIHPGAQIGEYFFIDHGTGVVVGETCIVGKRCTLYQGVTLGALSFPKDSEGNPLKGMPRHPILEDGVIVYAGATILGRVTLGQGCVIGGNTWVTESLPPRSRISQKK